MIRRSNIVEAASLPEVHPSGASFHSWINLKEFENTDYDPGRGAVARLLWHYVSLLFFEGGWLPSYKLKVGLLRCFGARIGEGVVIKPNVRIKYPWRLVVGDHCWIGQDAWIDNLADVRIGSHACVSQGVYLCTGSHDYRSRTFDLIVEPIIIEDGAWVAARSTVLPGVTVGANAIVAGGSIVTRDVPPATVVAGNPAKPIGEREPPRNA
jgi:putative colanic acid biosynthesis acetyltransferase WcaF